MDNFTFVMALLSTGIVYLFAFLFLGIYSLNYYKARYNISKNDFISFFYELKFPLNIYRDW